MIADPPAAHHPNDRNAVWLLGLEDIIGERGSGVLMIDMIGNTLLNCGVLESNRQGGEKKHSCILHRSHHDLTELEFGGAKDELHHAGRDFIRVLGSEPLSGHLFLCRFGKFG